MSANLTAADIHFGGPEHVFRRVGEGQYRLTVVDLGVEFEIDRLWRDRDALKGELVVSCGLKGARTFDGCLSSGNFNLSSTTERWHRARHLKERARTGDDVDWDGLLNEFCIRVTKAEREGLPARPLKTYDRRGPDATIDVDGLPIFRHHPMITFGDGGSFKSYLGLYLAGRLEQMGVPVLYADWELAGEDHRERLERLFGADMPGLYYLRCDRPMVAEIDRIRRCVNEQGIQYVVCDSVAWACGGPPEAAEVAGAYFRAVRQFGDGVGSLHVAHITKPKDDEKGGKAANLKPFGSVFWHNSARATWYVKRTEGSPDGQQFAIGLYNQKVNLGAMRSAVGFEVTFEEDQTLVRRVEVASVNDLAAGLPIWRRCQHVLKHGQRTVAEIAEELEANPDSVEKAMKRRTQTFVRVTSAPDGVHRWGLAERRSA